jgi:hypothetical protein
MRPIVSDYSGDGRSVVVDWTRLTPYASTATFVSAVFDAQTIKPWTTAVWNGSAPTGTAVVLSVRYGNTAAPDGSWTSFVPVANGTIGGSSRYLQYRLELTSSDAGRTPVVTDVTVTFTP